jgi:peptidase A4-like protein
VQPGRHAALVTVLAAAVLAGGAAATTADVSANWAGYVATGPHFSGVAGSWTIAPADCLTRASAFTSAAFWIGLGGSAPSSKKIEQIGTDADCNPDGTESYFAWYELWPRRAVMLSLDIEAGDRVRAAVDLHGDRVTLTLSDLTSGRRFARTVAFADPDGSSAEWIGEAPTLDLRTGKHYLPLTRFGRVVFSQSTATAGGRTAPIAATGWHAKAVRLDSLRGVAADPVERYLGRLNRARVVPSSLDASGGRFSLSWTSGSQ